MSASPEKVSVAPGGDGRCADSGVAMDVVTRNPALHSGVSDDMACAKAGTALPCTADCARRFRGSALPSKPRCASFAHSGASLQGAGDGKACAAGEAALPCAADRARRLRGKGLRGTADRTGSTYPPTLACDCVKAAPDARGLQATANLVKKLLADEWKPGLAERTDRPGVLSASLPAMLTLPPPGEAALRTGSCGGARLTGDAGEHAK